MASECSFQVPDSDFHVPACAPFAPRQQERALLPPSSNASCRSFRFRERLSEFFRLQGPSRTCVGTGSLTGRIATKQKVSIRLLRDVVLLISFKRSAVEFPASSFRRREPDRRGISCFQLQESICAWPFWGWEEFPISGFRLPALARWM